MRLTSISPSVASQRRGYADPEDLILGVLHDGQGGRSNLQGTMSAIAVVIVIRMQVTADSRRLGSDERWRDGIGGRGGGVTSLSDGRSHGITGKQQFQFGANGISSTAICQCVSMSPRWVRIALGPEIRT